MTQIRARFLPGLKQIEWHGLIMVELNRSGGAHSPLTRTPQSASVFLLRTALTKLYIWLNLQALSVRYLFLPQSYLSVPIFFPKSPRQSRKRNTGSHGRKNSREIRSPGQDHQVDGASSQAVNRR